MPDEVETSDANIPASSMIDPDVADELASAFVPVWQFEDVPFSAGAALSERGHRGARSRCRVQASGYPVLGHAKLRYDRRRSVRARCGRAPGRGRAWFRRRSRLSGSEEASPLRRRRRGRRDPRCPGGRVRALRRSRAGRGSRADFASEPRAGERTQFHPPPSGCRDRIRRPGGTGSPDRGRHAGAVAASPTRERSRERSGARARVVSVTRFSPVSQESRKADLARVDRETRAVRDRAEYGPAPTTRKAGGEGRARRGLRYLTESGRASPADVGCTCTVASTA